MSFDSRKVELGDIVDITSSKRIFRKEYVDSGVPFYRGKEIIEKSSGKEPSTDIFISEERFEEIKNKHDVPQSRDILLTSVGTLGVPYQVQEGEKFYFKDGNLTWIKGFSEEVLPDFVFVWLMSPQADEQIKKITIGSTQQALTISSLKTLEVNLPTKDRQRLICNHYFTLSHKIKLNKQTNETLEAMAQAIFKSWFVDFDPVRAKIEAQSTGRDPHRAAMAVIAGISPEQDRDQIEAAIDQKLAGMTEAQQQQLHRTAELFPDELVESELGDVPKGWEVKSIGSLTKKLSKGTTPSRKARANADDEPSIKFLKVKDIGENCVIERSGLSLISESIHLNQLKRSILQINDILFSIAGTIGRVAVIDEELANSNCNQALAFIRLKDIEKHFNLLLLNLKSRRIQDKALSLIVQGVQANLSLTNIKEFQIIVPNDNLLATWNSTTSEIMGMIESKQYENRSLRLFRDTLLPKLISGELELN